MFPVLIEMIFYNAVLCQRSPKGVYKSFPSWKTAFIYLSQRLDGDLKDGPWLVMRISFIVFLLLIK